MVRSIEKAPICLSLEDIVAHAGNKVWMEIDDKIYVIVSNPE
jgi:hypothetical protein